MLTLSDLLIACVFGFTMVFVYNRRMAYSTPTVAVVAPKTSIAVAPFTSTTKISSAATTSTTTETVIVKQARNRPRMVEVCVDGECEKKWVMAA
jgi:hypothetical protein